MTGELPPPCWAPWWVEAYWDEHKILSWNPLKTPPLLRSNKFPLVNFSSCHNRYFFNVSPFLIHKGITACVGDVKTIRKLRSGDLFIEKLLHQNRLLALASLQKLAHFDIQVKRHATLNYSRGVISAADLYNVTEKGNIRKIWQSKMYPKSGEDNHKAGWTSA
ncbi:uncharacterized protein TNCV_3380851 [Trichonephila clavipes]|nr:uncharacterized protein TNCV_3380851 [Trichonephila clavipes]